MYSNTVDYFCSVRRNFVHWKKSLKKERKMKNESNSNWVTFISFPLMKRIFLRWFFSNKLFKKMHSSLSFWMNSNLIKIRSVVREVSNWVYWTYNRICAFDTNVHNNQSCTGIEPALPSSTAGLKQSTLIIRSWKHTSTTRNI